MQKDHAALRELERETAARRELPPRTATLGDLIVKVSAPGGWVRVPLGELAEWLDVEAEVLELER